MLGPVGLLTGVVAVAGVPAAVEDGLLLAVGTPLLLLGLIYCLLLLQLQLLLHLGNEPIPLLLQALPHLRHGQLWRRRTPATSPDPAQHAGHQTPRFTLARSSVVTLGQSFNWDIYRSSLMTCHTVSNLPGM